MGNNIGYSFQRSFRVLNALLWPVVVLNILESPAIMRLFFNLPEFSGAFLVWAIFILKIVLALIITGFVHGFLIDLATEQELFQSHRSFLKNSKMFFKASSLIFILIVSVHFIVFLLRGPYFTLDAIKTILFPLTTFIWLNVVLKSKSPNKRPFKSLDLTFWLLFFLGSISYYSVFLVQGILQEHFIIPWGIGTFLLKYLDLFIFLVLAHAIMARSSYKVSPPLKEIYLVNPLQGWTLFAFIASFMPKYPFIFVILKALTPQGYAFKEFNQVIWRKDCYQGGKLVAITCFTSNAVEAYKIAKGFRQAGSFVVMGGSHVTAFPEEALQFCDAVVTGPVEGVWPRIIDDYEAGKMRGIYTQEPAPEAYDKIHDFLLTQSPSIIAHCLETTRGCKFNCYFCGGGHALAGYRKMSLDKVMALLTRVRQHTRTVTFMDDNIYCDPAYSKELFRSMAPLNLRWSGSSSLDIAKDPEALALCKQSGCRVLLIGYEIFPGSKEIKRTGKFSLVDDYMRLSRIIRKQGIGIKAHFIYGFEGDGFFSFWKLWWFAVRLLPMISSLSILTPLPNSRFYKDMLTQDRLLNLNWSKYNLSNIVFQHSKISNPFFRMSGSFIVLFFFMTTSGVGLSMLFTTLSIIGIVFGRF